MNVDIGYGDAAAVRLAEGAPLGAAIDTADPAAWTALDAGVRRIAWYTDEDHQPNWARTEGGRSLTAALRRPERLTEARLAIALCHRDGRIRRGALGQVTRYPALLPLVVIRCADWAPQVRERARERLAEVLDGGSAIRLAPLILRLGRRGRGDFATRLTAEVLRREPAERLTPLLTHPDRDVRRFVYGLAVEDGTLSPAELADAAARDHDTVVQRLCAEAALAAVPRGPCTMPVRSGRVVWCRASQGAGAPTWRSHVGVSATRRGAVPGRATRAGIVQGPLREGGPYDDVLLPLLGARNPQVRSAGVTALRRAGHPERAEPFLADRSGLVRACARYVVRQGGGDPLSWYRRRCADPGDPGLPPGAVVGLAECGGRADAELLWPLLGHPAAGVRARAVAGLRTLDVTDVARLRSLLDDPAPGVVREATAALLPSARSLDADWLTERLGAEWPRHVRVAAFRLLDAHEGLVRLRSAVALVDDEDVKLRHWARQSVQGWRLTADVPIGTPEVGELLDRGRHLFSEYVLERRKREAGILGGAAEPRSR
ncbi:hypothetical protein ACGFNV_22235 [Streptomyces sp. NPDC048751]|uniref:hypothetical protein n=1 Tax=Streptomyces sp. NPDC048751 TaxID=3365591 RepID=UPI0037227320